MDRRGYLFVLISIPIPLVKQKSMFAQDYMSNRVKNILCSFIVIIYFFLLINVLPIKLLSLLIISVS